MSSGRAAVAVALCLSSSDSGHVRAQCSPSEDWPAFTSSTATEDTYFARWLGASEEWLCASTSITLPRGDSLDAVAVFRRGEGIWIEESTLFDPELDGLESFGTTITLKDDQLFVSSLDIGEYDECRVFVYSERGGAWQESQRLQADEEGVGGFGYAVEMEGDWLAIGAPGSTRNGVFTGSVYVFRRTETGWIRIQRLYPPDFLRPGSFGRVLAMAGATLAVGDPGVNGRSDRVLIYERDGNRWALVQEIASEHGRSRFAEKLVLSEDHLLVMFEEAGVDKSKAMVAFGKEGSRWVERQVFAAPVRSDMITGSESIALNGDYVAIGSADADSNDGLVHLFEYRAGTWQTILELSPPIGDEPRFGSSLQWSGSDLLVSMPSTERETGALVHLASCDLGVTVWPQSLAPSESGAFTGCGVLPDSIVLLSLVGVSGTSYWMPLAMPRADPSGRWALDFTMPLIASGVSLELMAYGFGAAGTLEVSSVLQVVVL